MAISVSGPACITFGPTQCVLWGPMVIQRLMQAAAAALPRYGHFL